MDLKVQELEEEVLFCRFLLFNTDVSMPGEERVGSCCLACTCAVMDCVYH